MMKQFNIKGSAILSSMALLLMLSFSAMAQKTGIVDITKVLESVEDYQQAQNTLDNVAATWRQDIAQEYDEIKGLYNKYQAEQVLLSDEARKKREDEIMDKEKMVRNLQRKRFGPEGDLFKRRQELVQPIQDRVYAAIEEYADNRGYDFVFDKSGSAGLIYSNEKFDITEDIIKSL